MDMYRKVRMVYVDNSQYDKDVVAAEPHMFTQALQALRHVSNIARLANELAELREGQEIATSTYDREVEIVGLIKFHTNQLPEGFINGHTNN